jgi:hypothetical protein
MRLDWQIDQYKRIRRALQAHLTRTIYSDTQGEPPARTWGQDVAEWVRGVDRLYSEVVVAPGCTEFVTLGDWYRALLRANDYALSKRRGG